MAATLIKKTLNIKVDDKINTIPNIMVSVADDDLLLFATAYNSLQAIEADKFIKREQYELTA